MVVTGLLGVGTGELVLIVLVFLLLFGVDGIPRVAKTLGRLRADWDRTRRDVEREFRSEEEREADRRSAFERERERHVRASLPEVQEEKRLRAAAEALGVDTRGKDAQALREAIAKSATRNPGDGQRAE